MIFKVLADFGGAQDLFSLMIHTCCTCGCWSLAPPSVKYAEDREASATINDKFCLAYHKAQDRSTRPKQASPYIFLDTLSGRTSMVRPGDYIGITLQRVSWLPAAMLLLSGKKKIVPICQWHTKTQENKVHSHIICEQNFSHLSVT